MQTETFWICDGSIPHETEINIEDVSFDEYHNLIKIKDDYFQIEVLGDDGNIPIGVGINEDEEFVLYCQYSGMIMQDKGKIFEWCFGDIMLYLTKNPHKRIINNGYYQYS